MGGFIRKTAKNGSILCLSSLMIKWSISGENGLYETRPLPVTPITAHFIALARLVACYKVD
jgi:hypothetical protein